MEYDNLAEVYERWSTGDEAYYPSLQFYLKQAEKYSDNLVELGIGTGRIALELAKHNYNITGIDISENMLQLCRENFTQAGLSDRLELIEADITAFELEKKADLILLPFRTIGHLIGEEEFEKGFLNIYNQLKPGGLFIFDHYIFDKAWAVAHERSPRFMYSGIADSGEQIYIWDTYKYQYEEQIINCYITVERGDENNTVIKRSHYPLKFSWIYPEQVKRQIQKTGFLVKHLYGDFDERPFDENSVNQIWVLEKPK